MDGPELILPGGGAQPDYVASVPALGNAPASVAANTMYLARVRVGRPVPTTGISFYVGTAAGNVQVGVYASDGTNFVLQASSASTAAAGTNAAQTVAFTAPFTFQPGIDYWLAIWVSSGSLTIARGGSVAFNFVKLQAVNYAVGAGGLPSSTAISNFGTSALVQLLAA